MDPNLATQIGLPFITWMLLDALFGYGAATLANADEAVEYDPPKAVKAMTKALAQNLIRLTKWLDRILTLKPKELTTRERRARARSRK